MTFRARLVLAATGAVLVVVVLGSFVTYIVAYNSLVGSVDATLSAEADAVLTAQPVPDHPHRLQPAGGYLQPDGGPGRDHSIPTRPTWCCPSPRRSGRRPPARGGRPSCSPRPPPSKAILDVRQIVAALPPGFAFSDGTRPCTGLPRGGALQLTVPLTGVNLELRHLALALWLIVLIGVALAVLLGLGVGRTVLRPLNSLTRHRRGAGRDHRRVQTARPRWSRRARPAAPGLQPAAGGPRHLPGEPAPTGAGRLPRAAHPADQPQDQHGGGPTPRRAGPRGARGADRRRPHPVGRADHPGGRHGRAGPRRAARS